jgi:hypothetical protein
MGKFVQNGMSGKVFDPPPQPNAHTCSFTSFFMLKWRLSLIMSIINAR